MLFSLEAPLSSIANEKLTPKALNPTQTDVNLSQASALPPEWRVSTIRIQDLNLRQATMAPSGDTTHAISSGAGGNIEGLDPYAGSAPDLSIARKTAEIATSSTEASGITALSSKQANNSSRLDVRAFEQWLQNLRTRLLKAKGTIQLNATVRSDGNIERVEIAGGTASLQLKLFVIESLKDKRLFHSGEHMEHISLPIISLG